MSIRSIALRTVAVSALIAGLAGCGTSLRGGSVARASGASNTPALAPAECAATVVSTFGKIGERVYSEGVSSERTASAVDFITRSVPLREAAERNDPRAARAAARALTATGHLTNLKVIRGGETLTEVGAPGALAPLHGNIIGAGGSPIASFIASVWAGRGFISEIDGIDEGSIALRAGTRNLPGSFALPRGELPAEGTVTVRHVAYRYTSFPAAAYPAGDPLRVYMLRSIPSTAGLCGATPEDTLVNTLSRVATRIYTAEAGRRALSEVHRVQHDQALLHAVAAREPAATRRAIEALLNEHIVRLRVSAGGRLLSDVGGPFVLAPVSAPLHLGGRAIGRLVLSIQDDEGYKRLTGRLAGLNVLMYMGSKLVKNSLGPNPGNVPSSGTYHYRGHTFRVYTLHAQAFPSGPLKVNVLIPIPYS